ncbi:uncharacterized protein [Trachinotus anak]|uniref:uncharacterized protein isoform X2 n=1 Tax=Trachinotus anak TaxID=443729 RepID=UPI0039F249AF
MMNFNVVAALLCTCSWISVSVSVSEFHTLKVQSGEEVTLLCTNYSSTISHIFWFRLDNRPNISCISSMFSSDGNASFCDGFKNGKFNMTSNMTTLFLQIKSVDSSDSGLYFCGSKWENKTTIVSATYLKVQEESVEPPTVMSVILGGLIIFLIIVVIVLVVKTRKLHADLKTEEQSPQHRENQGSENLNYAALNFHSKAKRSRRPASERELESNVVYAATR